MKFKLQLTKQREEAIKAELLQRDIEISEESDLILTEENYQNGHLVCKDDTDTVFVDLDEILYIEAVGKDIIVHTNGREYRTSLRIYQMENSLPQDRFIRISSGVIISRNSIRKIMPGLSSKFYLTLKNGDSLTVTRTYYFKFKEYFRI